MPRLEYPNDSAAANVEPEPAKGSRIMPIPSGSAALTICLINFCGFKDGWLAMARSSLRVGADLMTSPNG